MVFLFFIPILLLSLFILCYLFIAQPYQINGTSMFPTYREKAYIIAEKVSYTTIDPKRNDVVIFQHPQKNGFVIERIIGLPNEEILLKDGRIYINNSPLDEPYLEDATTFGKEFLKDNEASLIPEDSYVLMGDNRGRATDSRDWGFVPRKNIVGRVALCYLNCKSNQ